MPGLIRHCAKQMRITLERVSKAFGREAVIRDLSHVFEAGSRTAILGPNGSGKSTLLQLIAGASAPSGGAITCAVNGSVVPAEHVYRHVSIAAPYLGLYEDLSLREAINVHSAFKAQRGNADVRSVAHTAMLEKHLEKPVRDLSSGMKQRLKLTLAILSDTPLLLLDEPGSNLDANGLAWFRQLLLANLDGRTMVVASNRQTEETFACDRSLDVSR